MGGGSGGWSGRRRAEGTNAGACAYSSSSVGGRKGKSGKQLHHSQFPNGDNNSHVLRLGKKDLLNTKTNKDKTRQFDL